jgi:hypothetical protein
MNTGLTTSLQQNTVPQFQTEQTLTSRRIELSEPMEAMEFFYRQGWTKCSDNSALCALPSKPR